MLLLLTNTITGGASTCGGLVGDSYVVLHDSAEDCCSAEYSWLSTTVCVAASGDAVTTTPGTGKFYIDWASDSCAQDCEGPPSLRRACAELGRSLRPGTGKFYVHWSSERCAQDCEGPAPCAGLVHNWDDLYDTESGCCDKIPWIERDYCVYPGIITEDDTAADGNDAAARSYYPDWAHHSGTCLNDGNEPVYMKKTNAWLFGSLEECCNQHFSGWNKNKCMGQT